MICSQMKLATAAPVALQSGMASTHFVKYSIAANIKMYPLDDGLMGPMRSSPQVWKGHGVVIFCRLVGGCVDQVCLHLTSVTCFNEVCRISLHSWPIIAKC